MSVDKSVRVVPPLVKCQGHTDDVSFPALVGTYEIAALLGVSRQRVQQLAAGRDFPRPVAVLHMGKVWREADVRAWAEARGRL